MVSVTVLSKCWGGWYAQVCVLWKRKEGRERVGLKNIYLMKAQFAKPLAPTVELENFY